MNLTTKILPLRSMNCPTASRIDERLPSVSLWILPSMQPTTQREMSIGQAPGTACSDKAHSRGPGEALKQLKLRPLVIERQPRAVVEGLVMPRPTPEAQQQPRSSDVFTVIPNETQGQEKMMQRINSTRAPKY